MIMLKKNPTVMIYYYKNIKQASPWTYCSSTKHEDILIGLWFFNDLAN